MSFAYEEYPRDHDVRYENGLIVAATCAPDYGGDPGRIDPEETFVAAIVSCHMLTFLALCSKKGLTVDEYRDAGVGHLEKSAEGRMMITRVDLHPQVVFAPGVEVDPNELARLHDRAHRGCFIANSIQSEVTIHLAAAAA
jgi:organic hydroperoxide reductase OsmC/OhrA